MPLRPLAELAAADWFLDADADWWTKVCLGPPGFEAYARLQLVAEDDEYNLIRATTDALRRILPAHTNTVGSCYFGQWTGSGWEPPTEPDRERASLMYEPSPGLRAAVRDYHLFAGELADSIAWDEQQTDPPHLMWPEDHAWFVAKDVDPDWIGVGGSQALIDEILASPDLDAAPSAYDASDWEVR